MLCEEENAEEQKCLSSIPLSMKKGHCKGFTYSTTSNMSEEAKIASVQWQLHRAQRRWVQDKN
jgi:hypothetical protein